MVNLGTKAFIAILVLVVAITLFAVCWYLNVGGIGTALGGVAGPFLNGLNNVSNAPLAWAQSGALQKLVFWLGLLVILPATAAFIVWHYDVPYKITGYTTASPAAGYSNNMNREPTEPERAPQTVTK